MKKRTLNIAVFALLVVVLVGVGGYAVYAATSMSFTVKNTISFTATDEIFYSAEATATCGSETINATSVNQSGQLAQQNSNTQLAFSDITLTKENNVVEYQIKVYNYTTKNVIVSISEKEDHSKYVTNTFENGTPNTNGQGVYFELDKYINNSQQSVVDNCTFHITTTASTHYSFDFDNSFVITLTAVTES